MKIQDIVLAFLDFPADMSLEKLQMYEGTGVDAYITANSCKPFMLGWYGGGRDEFREYEGEIAKLVRRKPDIRLILQVGSLPGAAPLRWCQEHPDELAMHLGGARLTAPSLASRIWREESSGAIRRLVAHFEAGPFAANILGYLPLCHGLDWQGIAESRTDTAHDQGITDPRGDISAPMVQAFRDWLRNRYRTDAELQSAWRRPDVTFATAMPPDAADRDHPDQALDVLPAERWGRRMTDYFTCYNELHAELALAWCRAAKAGCGRRKAVGICFGRQHDLSDSLVSVQSGGQAFVSTVLDSDDIDFVGAPGSYRNRALVGGTHDPVIPVHSVTSRGKPFLDIVESGTDVRRAMFKPIALMMGGHASDTGEAWMAADPWQTEQLLKRDAGYALAHRHVRVAWMEQRNPVHSHWFTHHEWGPLAYDTPEIRAQLARLNQIARTAREGDSVAEVAVFTSAGGCLKRPMNRRYCEEVIEPVRQNLLPALGTPFDDFLLEDWDLAHRDGRRYKAYLFLDDGPLPDGVDAGQALALHLDTPAALPDPAGFRRQLEQAGVHVYAPAGDLVFVSRHHLCVTAGRDGDLVVQFPQAARLTDLFTGQVLDSGTRHVLAARAGQTWLFGLGDDFGGMPAADAPQARHAGTAAVAPSPAASARRGATTAAVRVIEGVPELFINGELAPRTIGRLAEPGYNAVEKLQQYREAGLNIFFTSLHEANDWCWDGEDGYDYETYEAHIAALVEAKPDIKLIPYVGGRIGAPYLWCKRNPDEVLTRADGSKPRVGSFASERWRRDSTEAIRRFVEHFEASPWADNIIGYNPIYINNEWLAWMDHGSYADFSTPMVEGFRRWLRDHYGNDVSALRESWKDSLATFESARVPTGAERLNHGDPAFFGTVERRGNKVGDYYRCLNDFTADLAMSFAGAVKGVVGSRKLCGMMHAYHYSFWNWPPNPGCTGHCAKRRLLACPDIDYFHSPYDYLHRCFGGVHYSQQAVDAVTAAGKLHFDQIDTKTYVHKLPNTNASTPWQTLQALKRDVANSLSRNSHHYYYEMSVGCFRGFDHPCDWREMTYNQPDIRGWIAQLTALAKENQAARPAHAAEIAFVSSAEYGYCRVHRKGYGDLYHGGFRNHVLAFAGAPFADYILEDLDHITRRHKLYIFPDAHLVPAPLRRKLHAKLKAEGATAVWFYAPGYVDERGPSLENMTALTGFRFRKHDDFEGLLQVDVTDFDHPITDGLRGVAFPATVEPPADGCAFGSDLDPEYFRARQEWSGFLYERENYRFTPAFTVDDPDARVLGILRGVNAPGLAVKEMDGWRSVFISAPMPPWKLLSNLLRHAGGHVYSETSDLIYANADYVAFQANGDGAKTLLLPGRRDIHDALSGTLLVRDEERYSFTCAHGQVEFFRLAPPAGRNHAD